MKRFLDIAIAGTALFVLSPLLAVLGVLVRLRLGSPVLFRQRRCGLAGREFDIAKFRTMRPPRYPGEPDAARVHPFGAWLRRSSLDELPQLLHVLAGEMSLVGPRPALPRQVVHYNAEQRRRLEVRPGLTGYAQTFGRKSLTWPERFELDVWYVEHRSVFLDLVILSKTVDKLLRPDEEVAIDWDFPHVEPPAPRSLVAR